jgi:hypothetical protein
MASRRRSLARSDGPDESSLALEAGVGRRQGYGVFEGLRHPHTAERMPMRPGPSCPADWMRRHGRNFGEALRPERTVWPRRVDRGIGARQRGPDRVPQDRRPGERKRHVRRQQLTARPGASCSDGSRRRRVGRRIVRVTCRSGSRVSCPLTMRIGGRLPTSLASTVQAATARRNLESRSQFIARRHYASKLLAQPGGENAVAHSAAAPSSRFAFARKALEG